MYRKSILFGINILLSILSCSIIAASSNSITNNLPPALINGNDNIESITTSIHKNTSEKQKKSPDVKNSHNNKDFLIQPYLKFIQPVFITNSNPLHGIILSSSDEKTLIRDNTIIYVSNSKKLASLFEKSNSIITKHLQAITEPNKKSPKKISVLGFILYSKGNAKWLKNMNNVSVFKIEKIKQEIYCGDLIIPENIAKDPLPKYSHTYRKKNISGKVLKNVSDNILAKLHDSIVINLGINNEVDIGTILYLHSPSILTQNPNNDNKDISIPGKLIGKILVYRASQKLSIGLIINSTKDINEGTIVNNYEY